MSVFFDGYYGSCALVGLFLPCSGLGLVGTALTMTDYIAHYIKAGHPDTHVDELRALARHQHHLVRMRVAEHSNIPEDVLHALAQDEQGDVLIAVCEHPLMKEELIMKVVALAGIDVLYALAENPHMPPGVLQLLAEHDNPYVCHRAQKTLRAIGQANGKPSTVEPHKGAGGNSTRHLKFML